MLRRSLSPDRPTHLQASNSGRLHRKIHHAGVLTQTPKQLSCISLGELVCDMKPIKVRLYMWLCGELSLRSPAPPLSPGYIRAAQACPRHPIALASVPSGVVLVRVRVRVSFIWRGALPRFSRSGKPLAGAEVSI